jgi:DNA-binding IclR family transcriptional regulator
MPNTKEKRAVQSVEVGGRLLLVLARNPGPMSLKELAAGAELPPSRAHPYLVSFGRLGLIEQESSSGHYRLGPAALQIGLACLNQLDPIEQAAPVAKALSVSTGQTVILTIWANFGPTVVRMFESRQPLHVNMRLGTVMSILGTATGRAFAATLPKSALASAMTGALGEPARTDALVLPDRDKGLEADVEVELNLIRSEFELYGVTRAAGRPIPGVNAFSAPAFNHENKVALVITALGHEDNFSSDWKGSIAQEVRQAGKAISQRLGAYL